VTGPRSRPSDPVGEQLSAWGKVALIETRGRVTGVPARAAVGFVEDADGSFLVAAGSPDAAWARNLEADGRCRVTIGKRSFDAVAEPLDRDGLVRVVRELILKYGTPSEGLGSGLAFRVRPAAA
jgi:deazaflavin-dependent oxidoreductase (nitroreductase family)